MSRARLLVRRAGAHRGLLVLVALLVATLAAALGTAVGTVRVGETRVVQDGLTRGGAPGVVQVTTRLAPPEDAAAQDAALRRDVDALFAGTTYDLDREEVPDADSDDPFVRWTLTPDVAATDVADLSVLADGSDALLEAVLADDAVAVRGATVTGDLGERAEAADAAAGAAAAVALVPMLVLALAGVVAVAQVARLLAATRAGEVRLLVSRGTSPAQLTAAGAAEAGLVVGAGALAGAAAAGGVLVAQGAAGRVLADALVPSAVATALGALLVLVAVGGAQARAVAAARVADTSGRARRAATWGTVVLVLAAAGVTTWLLRRYGSPLVPTPDGGQTDPSAAAAPALVLAAAAAGAVALLGPVSRAWAAVAARGPGTRVLAARQVARRLAVAAVPVVLVVVAAGSVVLASAYAGTGQHLRAAAAGVAAGSDVRVVVDGASPGPVAAYEELPGAAAAAPVRVVEGDVDGETVTTTGIPTERIASVALVPGGQGEAEEIAGALRGPGPYAGSPRLPVGTSGLVLDVSGGLADAGTEEGAGADLATVPLTVWLADADGQLAAVATTPVAPDGDTAHGVVELRGDVPPAPPAAEGAPGAWTVAGFEAQPPGADGGAMTLRLSVDEAVATADGGATSAVDLGSVGWSPAGGDPAASPSIPSPGTPSPDTPSPDAPGAGPTLVATVDQARPPAIRVVPAARRDDVPAVLSRDLAGRLDVTTGGVTELPLDTGRLPVRVVGVVDVVPGSLYPAAAMVGLGELQAASLRTGRPVPAAEETWVRAVPGADRGDVDRLAAAAQGLAARAGAESQVATSTGAQGADAAAPVRRAFAVAALAAVLLALVGVGAVSLASVRERRGEVAVLRAVGVPPRAQGASRAVELVVVTAAALVVGVLAGWALAAATVPGLAAATLTGFAVVPTPTTELAPWSALVPGLLLVAGLAAVALAVRAVVAAQARDGGYREEVR
ncbi:FtsX-like permease family protein [Isoptericola sp. F-RaC21]|uniref:FtsX-like permease family protein n=1 Tax=Isoptericola sp. F-RaC21 TaxID=3141452 RepID=UPI00315B6802